MQNDAFKRLSKDFQDALVKPVNYINKKTKSLNEKRPSGLAGLTTANLKDNSSLNNKLSSEFSLRSSNSSSDSVSLHNFSLSTISKTSYDDNRSFTSHSGSATGTSGFSQQNQQRQIQVGGRSRAGSFLRSPLSPGAFSSIGMYGSYSGSGIGKAFSDLNDEPALVHCPLSVSTLDQFSPERYAWVRDCLFQNKPMESQISNILKSERTWDTVDGHYESQSSELLKAPGADLTKTGFNNLNEATGLVLVKLMQVTNRASSKICDIECNLRIGDIDRTSHPSRSFKDNPGNTATMNEVFLFDVDKPFQLELEVTGTPIATKFGTMAGFSNTQTIHLGQLVLPLPLAPMGKSVRTYKLQCLNISDGNQAAGAKIQPKGKADCEIVIMIGVHVLEEPVEDRSWETETLYQGILTVMTRGSRMASWKRYWAVLKGNAFKLYDSEYQTKRDPIAIIPLAHVLGVQPPDYDKVDVSSNGFSLVISPAGVDMSNATEFDLTDMDYNIYAFTDSAYLHECWTANLDEALEQYQENMVKRGEVMRAKTDRRRRSLVGSLHSNAAVDESQVLDERKNELVDLRFVS
ncbi:hypothetical protein BGZ58_008871 [Dissophora ornata]|nr:hypothetical protein BGZ58_008871 [Dissophora ornata]